MTDAPPKHVRVWVTDVWDNLRLPVTPATTVAELKSAGLARAIQGGTAIDQYSVKYRGGLILDETRTLEQLGAPDEAPFIILPTRRRPVN